MSKDNRLDMSMVSVDITLDFFQLRAIIMALAHCDHTQLNISDEDIQIMINRFKLTMAGAVINRSLEEL